MDYPGKYSNDADNEEIFKEKTVLNQLAGHLEFINTQDQESVTIGHKSGSFDRLNKDGKESLVVRDKREYINGDNLLNIGGTSLTIIDETEEKIVLGDVLEKIGDIDKWQKPMEEIKKIQRELHDKKRLFETKRTNKKNDIDQAPSQTKSGIHKKFEGINSKVIKNKKNPKISKQKKNSGTIPKIEEASDSYQSVNSSGPTCLTCWGKLLSPSSQDGSFAVETSKNDIIKQREDIQKRIFEFEKQLGQNKHPEGGSYIRTIAKDFIENIGLVFNDFESYRKDPKGKLVPCGVKIDPSGTTIYTQYRESSLVEYVDVEKFPGGSYELNICDGWNVTVGSNGINFKTTGPLNIFGSIVNITGENLLFNSRSETFIGGERIDLSGEIISLRPKKLSRELETGITTEEEQQVLIDGNLNVSLNAIIRGGAHVEGELSVHHITAPCEYQITETNFSWGNAVEPRVLPNPDPRLCAFGQNGVKNEVEPSSGESDTPMSPTYATLLPGAYLGKAVGYDSNGQPLCLDVYSERSENFAIVDPHVHPFKTIASKLIDSSTKIENSVGNIQSSGSADIHGAIRAIGSRNNWTAPVLAKPIKNSKNPLTVTEKFGGKNSPIKISLTDWEESSAEDSRPSGEGVRTSNYSDESLKNKLLSLEKELESKYKEIGEILSNLSDLKEQLGTIS